MLVRELRRDLRGVCDTGPAVVPSLHSLGSAVEPFVDAVALALEAKEKRRGRLRMIS